jgi:hypothetical protein
MIAEFQLSGFSASDWKIQRAFVFTPNLSMFNVLFGALLREFLPQSKDFLGLNRLKLRTSNFFVF